MDNNFNFISPPECPVFRPTKEEFKDPLEYIDRIKPIASKSGICKIIPPDEWRPPFSVNVNTFQFTPRVQKLYELEAQSRVKLNFMTKLSQFVRLQGNDKLKIPNINGNHVDLYMLHKLVHDEGGYDHITSNKLWPKIGYQLGYKMSNQVYTLRTHYEKIILPYDMMLASTNDPVIFESQMTEKPRPVLHPSTTKKRKSLETIPIDPLLLESNNELKRLQFSGAGPRMSRMCRPKEELKTEDDLTTGLLKRKCFSDYICKVCGSGDREDRLLICDNDDCQDSYHCECLMPPMANTPKQSWKCQNCVIKVLNKKPIEYGFPSSSTTYTLYDFGRSADRFKANYFGKDIHEVIPCGIVEKEFWRILQSFNDDVIVEYGADIHSSLQGSGFPTVESMANGKCVCNNGELNMDMAVKYSKEPWNLNNLPVNKRSILSFIRGNIDGMKVPWCYVGMVFSSFCWHIEDHWSFSINYLHWGEPKTWYGVSSDHADLFEAAMKKQAPELFENHEDLLHHITTTMNPNILQREGVPVHRTDQHAGQFVVTFPRAYHAGFNQGFNFAEAVNFCPATWLPMGRSCVDQYAELKRHCVFSHDELVCTMAEAAILDSCEIKDSKCSVNTDTESLNHDDCSMNTDKEFLKSDKYSVKIGSKSLDRDDYSVDTIKYPLLAQLGLSRDQICIDANTRRVVHSEFEVMIAWETDARAMALVSGVVSSERCLFETMDDDQRACVLCQTTCFLSAIRCQCMTDCGNCDGGEEQMECGEDDTKTRMVRRIVCLRHVKTVCDKCPMRECSLLYRFSIDELEAMGSALETRQEDFHGWQTLLSAMMTGNSDNVTLDRLRETLEVGAECGYDGCDEYVSGRALLERADQLVSVCGHWLRQIQAIDGVTTADLPKTVLLDYMPAGEIRNVSVRDLTEDNLRHMAYTISRYPISLPSCKDFSTVTNRLLQWRPQCHSLLDSYSNGHNDPASLLPSIVAMFEDAKRLFPGWSRFSGERTCLMLVGKTLQWLVRICECDDSVRTQKQRETGTNNLCLPVTMIKDNIIKELVKHGETLVATVRDTVVTLGDEIGQRFLGQVAVSIDARLAVLEAVLTEIGRVRQEATSLITSDAVNGHVMTSLHAVTRHCLSVGVRCQEVDALRLKLYKLCVKTVLSAGSHNGYIDLEHASQLMIMGNALFSESLLDQNDMCRHREAKNQVTMLSRAMSKVSLACSGSSVYSDLDILRLVLPRYYGDDETINDSSLASNCSKCVSVWSCQVTGDRHAASGTVMSLYQSMMVCELSSLDTLLQHRKLLSTSTVAACCVCAQAILTTNNLVFCSLCSPRSRRPTIGDLATLTKTINQCPSILSLTAIVLQALSKRTIMWLETLVAFIRLNVRHLSSYYRRLPPLTVVPVCIKDLFVDFTDDHKQPIKTSINKVKELIANLDYLSRVGHCIEVNLDQYLTVIDGLVLSLSQHP